MDVTTISEAPWRVYPALALVLGGLALLAKGLWFGFAGSKGVLRDRDALRVDARLSPGRRGTLPRGHRCRLGRPGLLAVRRLRGHPGRRDAGDERHHRNPQAPSSTDGVPKVGWGHGVVYRGHPYGQVRGCEMPDEAVMKSGVEPVGRTRLASELRALGGAAGRGGDGPRPGQRARLGGGRYRSRGPRPARRARIGRDADGLRRLGG